MIVNWQGEERLLRCIAALRADLGDEHACEAELIVVENGRDGRVSGAALDRWPGLQRVTLSENFGFAVGVNAGIAVSEGEWVAVLNDDTAVEPGFHAAMCEQSVSAVPRCGMLQPCMIRSDDLTRIDSTGVELRLGGDILDRDRDCLIDRSSGAGEVFCATAGAAWYRREMLEELAADGFCFDPGYFMYFEDVDLGWRCRLAGWSARYVPRALVRHDRHGSAAGHRSGFVKRQCARNRIRVLFANGSVGYVLRASPRLLRDLVWLLLDVGPRALVEIFSSARSGLAARRCRPATYRLARPALESEWFTTRGAE